ncbi:protein INAPERTURATE POLLEN1-like [Telopea speciosissima]|uniref:protein INAPERTURATE POLLEN1-like n=1 Tax=Telopea speciosissima TaxID=54955 RepID=UPI001CC4330C|nr:protein INAPERTURATE POLLEN1-like [Telopea speciosissima]
MMRVIALIGGGRRKSSCLFTDYYHEWIESLKNTILPQLRRSMSSSSASLLCTHVDILYRHFLDYYEALDLAAAEDVSQILYPDWRNPMEQPFLWFGDLHPNLFTNLLRSFLTDDDDDIDVPDDCNNLDRPLAFAMAWKNPSEDLMGQVDQIERGLKLMIPAIVTHARNAQSGFIDRVAMDWVRYGGRKEATKAIRGATKAQMDDLASVFVDANRLRRSMLTEIVNAINVFQAALYLERLAQFIVGFRDSELLCHFKQCKMPLSSASSS